ncbi:GNAT family N-acetyltransferase [Paenibacillus dakarensis]|uniref:GNAT family N-acetyltransferase n=1 Tax=Paenibacillus dakarensis TaxID=1527293 RepID=UPI0006D59F2A|nr:GNAT family N-acetyltransferase [Paenibacillus dakarensis]
MESFSQPSEALILDIESSEIDYMTDRMEAIRERIGNPEGVEMERIGHAICFYSKNMPWPAFNTVKGIRSSDIPYVSDMIRFYRSRERAIQIEIVPSLVDQQLLNVLSQEGLYASGYHTSMYMEMNPAAIDESKDIHVETLQREEFVNYAMVHCIGTGLPEQGIPAVARNNEVLYDRPGWKFFMVYVEQEPAAAAVMYVKNDIASLTFAATIPDYRRKGFHIALLKKRLAEAAKQHCRLAVSQCSYQSQSHRNMEKVGMKLGYIRTLWKEKS